MDKTLTTESFVPPVNWHTSLGTQVSIAFNSLAEGHRRSTCATLVKHAVLKVQARRHNCMACFEDS